MADVAVKAGDVVVGDARVLHGAHANNSSDRRTLITLWYIPTFNDLPSTMQERVNLLHHHQSGSIYDEWPTEDLQRLDKLLPGQIAKGVDELGSDKNDHNLDFMVRQPIQERMRN
jgi:ectoine hydroxylase-related dioxygenase (phytanoyl-CoA dioxygenase family)